jgi:hypothetical protein
MEEGLVVATVSATALFFKSSSMHQLLLGPPVLAGGVRTATRSAHAR